MKINEIVKHELIGLKVKIVKSQNKNLIGIHGKVVDETRNMLIIEIKDQIKKLVKDQSTFQFSIKEKKIEVEGKLLVGKPELRIKKTSHKKRV